MSEQGFGAELAGSSGPREALSLVDGVAIIIGIVIGAAIFETPSLVAGNVGSGSMLVTVWILGGVISLIGGLCYAELAASYPGAGGDYHYLRNAYGREVGFLFVWARMTVIQTGSIALIAFVFGDYATQIHSLGPDSTAVYAVGAVGLLTLVNLAGLRSSRSGQRWLTFGQVAGLLVLVAAGVLLVDGETAAPAPRTAGASFGLAMVFVLLTYGGWNEAAYLSAEMRGGRKRIVKVLTVSILTITLIYLAVVGVLLTRLGLDGMAASGAVGAELMRLVAGERGALLISFFVVACTLASINAMMFTGARSSWALGKDFPFFSFLGEWNGKTSAPVHAFLLQTTITLILIGFGALQRKGFESMVSYTAPVFWLFLLLTTAALFILRRKDRGRERPFKTPLYPITPLLFGAVCLYLLYASIVYTGLGSTLGLAVLALGAMILALTKERRGRVKGE